ncbi:hypothetical protein NIES21_15400 [Anabaenopsis circularis NIES-21]|uniref:Uncharacterized protein n=1 Tax=Anabaenopsis circularis NIES-21 TaxID=1085406 RepID=A0A1Z4GDX9_9CYAN|nr:hypothetical protein NIES21_15400 [Anabaenopsis circularis NIES-21]
MNQLLILMLTLLSLTFAIAAIYKQEASQPWYLKIEVRYGK